MSLKMRKLKRMRAQRQRNDLRLEPLYLPKLSGIRAAFLALEQSRAVDAAMRELEFTETIKRQLDGGSSWRRPGGRPAELEAILALSKVDPTAGALVASSGVDMMQRHIDNAALKNSFANGLFSGFGEELNAAKSLLREVEKAQAAHKEIESIVAFQREFDSIAELQRHMQKASAFQDEIDRTRAFKDQSDALTRLELEKKRQAFLSLRDENYAASLRLEGFDAAPSGASITHEARRIKYAR